MKLVVADLCDHIECSGAVFGVRMLDFESRKKIARRKSVARLFNLIPIVDIRAIASPLPCLLIVDAV